MKYAGRTARRLRGARKGKTMEDILKELEQEEIAEYKQELRRYLDEISDEVFYQYFDIMPMDDKEYDFICRDLARWQYYCLLARFLEWRSGVRQSRERNGSKRNSGKI